MTSTIALEPAAGYRPGRSAVVRVLLALALVTLSVLFSGLASAATWTPPPLRGHVVDEAGALTETEARQLDRKLDRARRQGGFAVVVLLLPKLPEGMSIEDVGYQAGNAWGVGSKTGDDGVLLIASLGDRKLRIETGKGVGGALTDLQSSRINREIIGPLLNEGRTYEGIDRGVDAILKELTENTPGGSEPGRDPSASRRKGSSPHGQPAARPATAADLVKVGIVGIGILAVIVLAIVSPGFREILFWVLLFGRFGGGGGGGGGGRDDDDGGSGYGGGGGSFGGGGSSDDY